MITNVSVKKISQIVEKKATAEHRYFVHCLVVLFVIWSLYRYLFVGMSVFVDETIGKLIFFALPVGLYVVLTQAPLLYAELSPKVLLKGIFWGAIFGGLLGFVSTFAVLSGKSQVLIAPTFISLGFWWQFFLGVLTGFWESVFFFGWVQATTKLAFPKWHLVKVLLFANLTFVLFHIPNVLSRFDISWGIEFQTYFFSQLLLLSAFAVGQGLLFERFRNLYTLTLVHAIWGTILLVFGR